MPFKKVGRNKYRGPSGRHFTKKQVRAYYAGAFGKGKKRRKGRRKRR